MLALARPAHAGTCANMPASFDTQSVWKPPKVDTPIEDGDSYPSAARGLEGVRSPSLTGVAESEGVPPPPLPDVPETPAPSSRTSRSLRPPRHPGPRICTPWGLPALLGSGVPQGSPVPGRPRDARPLALPIPEPVPPGPPDLPRILLGGPLSIFIGRAGAQGSRGAPDDKITGGAGTRQGISIGQRDFHRASGRK